MESALRISPRNLWARRSAKEDFPEAVGPTMATRRGKEDISFVIGVRVSASKKAYRPGRLFKFEKRGLAGRPAAAFSYYFL
jgi:hypothetical protein